MRPLSIQYTISHSATVLRRWAITRSVMDDRSEEMVVCISVSAAPSRADVASSNSSKSGLLYRARAMPTLCTCPPESRTPLSSRPICMPSGRFARKSIAAIWQHFLTRASPLALGPVNAMSFCPPAASDFTCFFGRVPEEYTPSKQVYLPCRRTKIL